MLLTSVSADYDRITHECNYPNRAKAAVVCNALPIERMTLREIDQALSERLQAGLRLYELDSELIDRLVPDLVVTQSLCGVCAPTSEIGQLLDGLTIKPELLWMSPCDLRGIEENIRELRRTTGVESRANRLVEEGRARLDAVASKVAGVKRPRVFCMEWLDPVSCSGHWIPEIVHIAVDVVELGQEGTDSTRIERQLVATRRLKS